MSSAFFNVVGDKMSKEFGFFSIVRHGEAQMNATGFLSGQLEPNPLTKEGRQQAKLLAARLQSEHFDSIYTSDLQRSSQTAHIVSQQLEQNMAIVAVRELRNRHFGHLEGKTLDDVRRELQPKQEVYETLPDENKYKFKFSDDWESDEALMTRFLAFLNRIAIKNPGTNNLVFSHHSIMRTLLIHQRWARYSELPLNSIENLAVAKVSTNGDRVNILDVTGIKIDTTRTSTSLL